MSKASKTELRIQQKKVAIFEGKLNYHLICFGDYLAKREGYKAHEGIDALHYYLIQKYRWLPSQVRSLSNDDLRFLFDEEMQGWTLTEEDRV